MRANHFDNRTGTWVRLVYNGATVAPGSHGPGSVIHASRGGRFVFDHLGHGAAGGPEAVYLWTPTS